MHFDDSMIMLDGSRFAAFMLGYSPGNPLKDPGGSTTD